MEHRNNTLTPEYIESCVVSEQYYNFPGTTATICCLTLKNKFTVIGQASSVSSEDFDLAIGRQKSRESAVREIWRIEGYLLREKLTCQGVE